MKDDAGIDGEKIQGLKRKDLGQRDGNTREHSYIRESQQTAVLVLLCFFLDLSNKNSVYKARYALVGA